MISARHDVFIEVAANQSFSKASQVLFALHQKYPDVKMSLLYRNSDTIADALVDEVIDVATAKII